jgi:hypothetical protein
MYAHPKAFVTSGRNLNSSKKPEEETKGIVPPLDLDSISPASSSLPSSSFDYSQRPLQSPIKIKKNRFT